jgi:hypothetical protein
MYKDHVDFIAGMEECFKIHKPINVLQHINRIKTKNHIIILNEGRKSLWQHSSSLPEKTLKNLRLEHI